MVGVVGCPGRCAPCVRIRWRRVAACAVRLGTVPLVCTVLMCTGPFCCVTMAEPDRVGSICAACATPGATATVLTTKASASATLARDARSRFIASLTSHTDFASVVVVPHSAKALEFGAQAAPITTADEKLISSPHCPFHSGEPA